MTEMNERFLRNRPKMVLFFRVLGFGTILLYALLFVTLLKFGLGEKGDYQVIDAEAQIGVVTGEVVKSGKLELLPVELPSGLTVNVRAINGPLPIGSKTEVWSAPLTLSQVNAYRDIDGVTFPDGSSEAYAFKPFTGLVGAAPLKLGWVLLFCAAAGLWSALATASFGAARFLKKTEEAPKFPGDGIEIKADEDSLLKIWIGNLIITWSVPVVFVLISVWGGVEYNSVHGLAHRDNGAIITMLVVISGSVMLLIYMMFNWVIYNLSLDLSYQLALGSPGQLPASYAWEKRKKLPTVRAWIRFSGADSETLSTLAETSTGTLKELIKTSKILGPQKA